MRLVAWHCRSGFHRKLEALHALAPDVAIIPECRNLEMLDRNAPGLAPTSAVWIGANPKKGLGVCSFGAHRLVRDHSVAVGARADWIATGLSDPAPLILDFDPTFAADV